MAEDQDKVKARDFKMWTLEKQVFAINTQKALDEANQMLASGHTNVQAGKDIEKIMHAEAYLKKQPYDLSLARLGMDMAIKNASERMLDTRPSEAAAAQKDYDLLVEVKNSMGKQAAS